MLSKFHQFEINKFFSRLNVVQIHWECTGETVLLFPCALLGSLLTSL